MCERAEVVVGQMKEAVGAGLWPVTRPSHVWCERAEVVVGRMKEVVVVGWVKEVVGCVKGWRWWLAG